MGNSKLFRTTDFYTISILVASKYEILGVEPFNKSTKTVVFQDSQELRETLRRHYNGQLMLASKDLINAIESVKGMIRFDLS